MTGHAPGVGAAAQSDPANTTKLARVRVLAPTRGYSNLFASLSPDKSLSPGDRFGSNDHLFGADDMIDAEKRHELHERMKRLAHRIRKEPAIPIDQSAPAADGVGEPVPSGYTYLLQFIAHDMVDTTTSVNVLGDQLEFAFANARARPLCLDTIYGPGPDETPHAYEPTALGSARPRTKFPTAPLRDSPPEQGNQRCLRFDIGRSVDVASVRQAEVDVRTQALLADPRNDAHVFMSQTTLLFQCLHNKVMEIIDSSTNWADAATLEMVYRRFLCARTAVTLIYREIILNDLLRRILYQPVYEHYIRDRKPLCDCSDVVPIEFSHGAFRFGHAMVRKEYRVNNLSGQLPLSAGMKLTSATKKGTNVLTAKWVVDWNRFFFNSSVAGPNASGDPNIAVGICPHEDDALQLSFDGKNPEDWPGLADRDLLSACYARLWSVPKLLDRLGKDENLKSKLPAFDLAYLDFRGHWQGDIYNWLKLKDEPQNNCDAEWAKVAADPPLPFFVLFEAMRVSKGLCLGPVGSIIVAETFRAAIERTPLVGPLNDPLEERLNRCAEAFLHESPDILAGIAAKQIDTMPKLLDFLFPPTT
jgi:hypothetical protein